MLGAFTGCSDDKDDDVDAALLVGVWRCTAEYDGEDDTYYPITEPDYMRINADGTGAKGLSSPTEISKYDNFTWHCEGRTFVFSYTGEKHTNEWNIETLTQDELAFSVDCEDEGYSWVEKEFYERVQ